MLQIDEHKTSTRFKFGILLVHADQVNESQWFSNQEPDPVAYPQSTAFMRFYNILGDLINLKDHTGYAAGLDTKNGNTGTYSVFSTLKYNTSTQTAETITKDANSNNSPIKGDAVLFDIMFHVSTLLPFTPGDDQQIQRKRHIGNDLVCLIFISHSGERELRVSDWKSNIPFDPKKISTQFIHVYLVVQECLVQEKSQESGVERSRVGYRIFTTSQNLVPTFTPSLPTPPLFFADTAEERTKLRHFALTKMINAEYASYSAPKFKSLHDRTGVGLLETMWKEFGDSE